MSRVWGTWGGQEREWNQELRNEQAKDHRMHEQACLDMCKHSQRGAWVREEPLKILLEPQTYEWGKILPGINFGISVAQSPARNQIQYQAYYF